MILLVNICKEKLHYYEFVKPVETILSDLNAPFFTKHYLEITPEDLNKASKIIICGTSLKDNYFIEDLSSFHWITETDMPILGICGGMQLIGLVYGGTLQKKTEIGFYSEKFVDPFLGLEGEPEVYHLHNNYVDVSTTHNFIIFSTVDDISQAIMHREKEIYGVLFHPEVRNKELIKNFIKNKK